MIICHVRPTKLLNLKQGSDTKGMMRGWRWELIEVTEEDYFNDGVMYKKFLFELVNVKKGRVVVDAFWSINPNIPKSYMVDTLIHNAENTPTLKLFNSFYV